MLRLNEFTVGDLAHAEPGQLTLLLPRSKYEQAALMGEMGDQRYGVALDGDTPGQAYLHKPDQPWEGILVPGVEIEIDEKSAFNSRDPLEVGALVREGSELAMAVFAGHSYRIGRVMKLTLVKDLPKLPDFEGVAFRKWRIVVGKDEDKRELLAISSELFVKARAAANVA
jgi:hypothetical protein